MSRLSKPNPSLEESRPFQGMSMVNQNAAGVDIGAHEIMACIPGPDNTQLVRSSRAAYQCKDDQHGGKWDEEFGVSISMGSYVIQHHKFIQETK